jgi:sugar (pentulose or hexulose) kinase
VTLSLGIDLGTSGIRCAVVDATGTVLAMTRGHYPDDTAQGWWVAVRQGLAAMHLELDADQMQAISRAAIDGTSGTMVLVDQHIMPVTAPLMYNSGGFTDEAAHIAQHAPPGDITLGPSSALARMLRLQAIDSDGAATHLCHQADFIIAKLTGALGHSDENNSLKTGFDVVARAWPAWFSKTHVNQALLPEVHPVGVPVAQISDKTADQFGFQPTLMVHAGTTDSIAAFLATGASNVGDAVTSLGTTLAIKMLSDVQINDVAQGIYSHRMGDKWLVGGASNTGGGALLAHFNVAELAELSAAIDTGTPSGLDYYPLPRPGERFPFNDPAFAPRVTPRDPDDVKFLQGLFEGIARIEAKCYSALQDKGGPTVTRIFTAGGGASNPTWLTIRQRYLQQPILTPTHSEAAVGAALLAASYHEVG